MCNHCDWLCDGAITVSCGNKVAKISQSHDSIQSKVFHISVQIDSFNYFLFLFLCWRGVTPLWQHGLSPMLGGSLYIATDDGSSSRNDLYCARIKLEVKIYRLRREREKKTRNLAKQFFTLSPSEDRETLNSSARCRLICLLRSLPLPFLALRDAGRLCDI